MNKYNVILENDLVLVRPMLRRDFNSLLDIALDPEIWIYSVQKISDADELMKNIDNNLTDMDEEKRYTFTVIEKKTGNAAGSTSYGNISVRDKRLEIGWTWLGLKYQGTGINKACKYLLLDYAFDELGMERVEFKTDVLNLQSRKALKKIGAAEEGILRSHTLMHDGRRRDTIYYSILKNEWLEIKKTNFKEFTQSN